MAIKFSSAIGTGSGSRASIANVATHENERRVYGKRKWCWFEVLVIALVVLSLIGFYKYVTKERQPRLYCPNQEDMNDFVEQTWNVTSDPGVPLLINGTEINVGFANFELDQGGCQFFCDSRFENVFIGCKISFGSMSYNLGNESYSSCGEVKLTMTFLVDGINKVRVNGIRILDGHFDCSDINSTTSNKATSWLTLLARNRVIFYNATELNNNRVQITEFDSWTSLNSEEEKYYSRNPHICNESEPLQSRLA